MTGLSDSDAVEAADLQRRRLLAAFSGGSTSDPAALARRPNRALFGGVALTVVAALGTGIGTLISDDVPSDWFAEGTVVVRETTQQRYLATATELRPVRNDTSLALAGRADPREVEVDEARFTTRPVGAPVGIEGAPARPPALPEQDVAWFACQREGEPLALLTAGGPTGGGRALLALTGDPAQLTVVAQGVAHPIAPDVAQALGYDPAAARPLPAPFAALIPTGADVTRLPAAEPPPVPEPEPAPPTLPGAVPLPAPPVEQPPEFLDAGTLVQDTRDDSLYVADGGQLRAVSGGSALRLFYGGEPPTPTRVSGEDLAGVPQGPELVVPGFPVEPPPVAEPGSVVCVSSVGGILAAEPDLPVLGLQPGPPAPVGSALATVWQPEGEGSLVRDATLLRTEVSAAAPVQLVTEGRGFALPEEEALAALGYGDPQVRPRPAPWLALLPRGPELTTLDLTSDGSG